MSGAEATGVPPEEAEVEAAGGRVAGENASARPGPGGEDLTSATLFGPGLATEATGDDGGPAQPEQLGALE